MENRRMFLILHICITVGLDKKEGDRRDPHWHVGGGGRGDEINPSPG